MSERQEYDPAKLGELVVYVAERSLGDPHFGKTKLNKILFLADFEAYRQRGRSITGAVYQHLERGPAPHQMLPVLRELQERGRVFIQSEGVFASVQERVVPIGGAEIDMFSAHDIAIVDGVLAVLRDLNNTEVSEYSHETIAWRMTDLSQEIPYGSAVLQSDTPTDDDLLWLKEVCA